MKALAVILSLVLILACNSGKKVGHQNIVALAVDSTIFKQRNLLKEMGLCKCINEGYGSKKIDSDYSLSLFYQQLLYSHNAQEKIESFATDYATSIQPTVIHEYKGGRAIIYFCMEMYNSAALDSLVMTLDHEIMK